VRRLAVLLTVATLAVIGAVPARAAAPTYVAVGDSYTAGPFVQLNAALAAQAGSAGAAFVDTYTPSIGHDACQLPGTRWVEPVLPLAPAAPVHPNAMGMAGMAAAVLQALR